MPTAHRGSTSVILTGLSLATLISGLACSDSNVPAKSTPAPDRGSENRDAGSSAARPDATVKPGADSSPGTSGDSSDAVDAADPSPDANTGGEDVAPPLACAAGDNGEVTGTVFAPTPTKFGAADPLYNALVYIPTQPVQPFAPGVSCDRCGGPISGAPVVKTLSGADGKFTLKNVPPGTNVPLVIQIGRWRRQVTIPKVVGCTSTALPAELTRLPRNKSEGDIPQFAIATGIYDPLECLLRKIGIDESEFTHPTASGRVHVYHFFGHDLPQPTPPGAQLVGDVATLSKYDLVLLPSDTDFDGIKPAAQLRALQDYADRGGRLFLTDQNYVWLRNDGGAGPWQTAVDWQAQERELGMNYVATVDQNFPKGQAFAQWLGVVGSSTQPGRLPIFNGGFGESYVDTARPPTQRWLSTDAPNASVQHFTFNTPVGMPADKQCGRLAYSNFNSYSSKPVSGDGDGDDETPFPALCADTPMTPQEKALEFMLFDASSCIQSDAEKPQVF